LEGSVQKFGQRVRITAQLIDATTGHHLWAEHYDHDFEDIFSLQDEITMKVITALQVKLTDGEIARIYSKGTNNIRAFLKQIEAYEHILQFTKDENEIGKALLRETIALDSGYANAYMLMAFCYEIEADLSWTKTPRKSYEKALEMAKKAISLDELNLKAHMAIASIHVRTGQHEKALAVAKKALSFDPNSAHAKAWYGQILVRGGMYKKAVPFLESALRYDPIPLDWVLEVSGLAYLWSGQSEKAIATFKKLANRELSGFWVHLAPRLLGLALRRAGKPEEAITMYEKALNLNPPPLGRNWTLCEIAKARFDIGQHEEAITMLQEELRRDSDNAQTCCALSDILMRMGRYEEALAKAKKAISISTSPPFWSLYFLGLSHWYMEQFEEAIAAFKEAIDKEPENLYAHVALAGSYSSAGREEDARAEAAEVLRIDPNFSVEQAAKHSKIIDKAAQDKYFDALRKAGLPE
jgi:tetratricopeptide (TPR) repeat protein